MSLSTYGVLSHLPYLKKVAAHMRRQQIEVASLQDELKELHRRFDAECYTPRFGGRLRELADCLQPQRVVGYDKIRLGPNHDGGYVVLNDFEGVSRAYSLGVGWDASFDFVLAEMGIDVHQFDHTIDKSPISHSRFTFFKKKIEEVSDFLSSPEDKQLLKIDIEGSEWGLFDRASSADLSRFNQIVGEFHDFDRFHDPAWHGPALRTLRKLNETHQLIHIHGNNSSPAFWCDGVHWPVAFEFTYALRSTYRFEPTEELFPGDLDFPNNFRKPDFYLDGLFKK